MNRYSPYYDPDEQRVRMTIDAKGSWVHIKTAESLRADADKEWGASATERARLEAEVERLREALESMLRSPHVVLRPDWRCVCPACEKARAALAGEGP